MRCFVTLGLLKQNQPTQVSHVVIVIIREEDAKGLIYIPQAPALSSLTSLDPSPLQAGIPG